MKHRYGHALAALAIGTSMLLAGSVATTNAAYVPSTGLSSACTTLLAFKHADGTETCSDALSGYESTDTVVFLKSYMMDDDVNGKNRINVDAPATFTSLPGVRIGGRLIFNSGTSGSTVKGMDFVVNSGLNPSSIDVNGASDVTIRNNRFTLKGDVDPASPRPAVDGLIRSVLVRSGSDNVRIAGNEFEADKPRGSYAMGAIALFDNGTGIGNPTITDNALTVTGAQNARANVAFVTTGPIDQNSYRSAHIDNLTVTGNTVRGDGTGNQQGVELGNVNGAEISGNTFEKTNTGVTYSLYPAGKPNSGVDIDSNTFRNTKYSVQLTGDLEGDGKFTNYADDTIHIHGNTHEGESGQNKIDSATLDLAAGSRWGDESMVEAYDFDLNIDPDAAAMDEDQLNKQVIARSKAFIWVDHYDPKVSDTSLAALKSAIEKVRNSQSNHEPVDVTIHGVSSKSAVQPFKTITTTVRAEAGTAQTHTVTFDSNGGSKVDSQTVENGKRVSKPSDPTKDGYQFAGWQLHGKNYDFDDPVTDDITLVAQWRQENGWLGWLEDFLGGGNTEVGWDVPVYRLYSPVTLEHLYTTDRNEVDHLKTVGWQYEGKAFTMSTEGTPVRRFYNSVTRKHVFTTSQAEIDALKASGWSDEGVPFHAPTVDDNRDVYRVYSPSTQDHMLTTDVNEYRTLTASGAWHGDGVVFRAK